MCGAPNRSLLQTGPILENCEQLELFALTRFTVFLAYFSGLPVYSTTTAVGNRPPVYNRASRIFFWVLRGLYGHAAPRGMAIQSRISTRRNNVTVEQMGVMVLRKV